MTRRYATGALLVLLAIAASTSAQEAAPVVEHAPLGNAGSLLAPPLPSPAEFPVQLVIDDDTAEAATGLIGPGGAKQFLWFNRFSSPGQFRLEQIWALFPPGNNMSVGASVQLVVYYDSDGNPANGATLLTTINETIQVLDGVTFSVYELAPAVEIPGSGDVLIGVVDRFVVSGVTSSTLPAAIDTTASQQRSWLASWVGDPPASPVLPSDGNTVLLDDILPGIAGNWMIRGFGTAPTIVEVPALDPQNLAIFAVLLTLAATFALGLRRA